MSQGRMRKGCEQIGEQVQDPGRNLERTSPSVSDQRARPGGERLNRRGRRPRSVGGVSAMAPGEARRNTAAADPQGRNFVIGKEIKQLT
jgi:hypothetical protein